MIIITQVDFINSNISMLYRFLNCNKQNIAYMYNSHLARKESAPNLTEALNKELYYSS